MLNSTGNNNVSEKINTLVDALHERYQPIYGFEHFTSDAERESSDRLAIVMNIANLLVKQLQRPIRVLDLGCAQGYFSLNLASISETVVGIDYLDKNVELCSGLAEYHHFEHVKFYENDIATFINDLQPDTYDLVLGLNVFHHVSYSLGYGEAQKIIRKIADYCKVLLTELALKEEPLYWAEALPDNVYSNLDGVAYQYTLQKFSTHLSDIERPFIFSSNYFWCDGINIGDFSNWKDEPHEYSNGYHLNSRRYFFSDDKVVKCYYFNSEQKENNIQEFQKEYDYYKSRRHFPRFIPTIISCSKNEWQGIVVLDKIDGELLSSRIIEGEELPHDKVISKLLTNVAELEKNGLYHTDLRIWNILASKDNDLTFIDIGSLSAVNKTTSWPFNVFIDFIILVQDIVSANKEEVTAVRYPFLLHTWYEDVKIKRWIASIWSISYKEWNFDLFSRLWESADLIDADDIELHHDNVMYWMTLIETFLVFNPREDKFIDSLQKNNSLDAERNLFVQVEKMSSFIFSLDAKTKKVESENEQKFISMDEKVYGFYNEYHQSVGYLDKKIDQVKELCSEKNRNELMDRIKVLEKNILTLEEELKNSNAKKQSLIKKFLNKLLSK